MAWGVGLMESDLEDDLGFELPSAPKSLIKNTNLNQAIKAGDDEFYTPMRSIEDGVPLIKDYLKGKIVYCNCDDYEKSNFYKYFRASFKELGLKLLICTGFKADGTMRKSKKAVFDGKELKLHDLEENGSFDSRECLDIAKEADIVITNPPFTLLSRGYWQMVEKFKKAYNTDFFFIGPIHSITYAKIFYFFLQRGLWVSGNNKPDFSRPSGREGKLCNTVWYSTVPLPTRPLEWEDRDLSKYDKFEEESHPGEILEIPKMSLFPKNYSGVMAVPITYVQFHDPELFDIIKLARLHKRIPAMGGSEIRSCKSSFARFLIQRKPK